MRFLRWLWRSYIPPVVGILLMVGGILLIAYGQSHGATLSHYRRPITVLVGISPSKTVVYRCHNADHDLPRVFGFGGCKQVKA